MPDFWQFPTVSMGLGPMNAIYQARFNRYLAARGIADTSDSRVWGFLGDGEMDEPEALGALGLAAREGLDNLIFVVNCNLQRLDGPVRGNGKIIQELEATFRGAGWHVIKVIWAREWDDLLARDKDGVLLAKMNETLDGEYQRLSVADGAYIREHFFGPDPRLRALVEHLPDEELPKLRRGGHDYRKVYAAYAAAVEHTGSPVVILAKTVKGWTLGPGIEARNVTHQAKKLTQDELKIFRDRLELPIPDDQLKDAPYYHPGAGLARDPVHARAAPAAGRRRCPAGSCGRSRCRTPPTRRTRSSSRAPSAPASTTMAFSRLTRNLTRDPKIGRRIVPIIPDEARTFGMDPLFKEVGIYNPLGQRYTPVDKELLLSYLEKADGQILEEGITEAGAMADFTAAGTCYAVHGEPMIPFYIFYSMFGFQRTGDLAWAFGDARGRGFLMGATAGRTTLTGEGLQHDDGHSHILASVVPNIRAYDPAFAYELALIVRDGIRRMYGEARRTSSTTSRSTTRTGRCRPMPEGVGRGHRARPVPVPAGREGLAPGPAAGVGLDPAPGHRRRSRCWRSATTSPPTCGASRRSSCCATRRSRSSAGTGCTRRPRRACRTSSSSWPPTEGPIVAATDYLKALPHMVAPWMDRPFTALGTDGFGRSDTREALRIHFEVEPGADRLRRAPRPVPDRRSRSRGAGARPLASWASIRSARTRCSPDRSLGASASGQPLRPADPGAAPRAVAIGRLDLPRQLGQRAGPITASVPRTAATSAIAIRRARRCSSPIHGVQALERCDLGQRARRASNGSRPSGGNRARGPARAAAAGRGRGPADRRPTMSLGGTGSAGAHRRRPRGSADR